MADVLPAVRNSIVDYKKIYCPYCRTATVAYRVRRNLFLRTITAPGPESALALFDGKYRNLVCSKCSNPPLKGIRMPFALAGWLVSCLVGLWVLFLALRELAVGRGDLDVPGILAGLAFIVPGQIILVMALRGRRKRAKEAGYVLPYRERDPCFLCGEPLERRGRHL